MKSALKNTTKNTTERAMKSDITRNEHDIDVKKAKVAKQAIMKFTNTAMISVEDVPCAALRVKPKGKALLKRAAAQEGMVMDASFVVLEKKPGK